MTLTLSQAVGLFFILWAFGEVLWSLIGVLGDLYMRSERRK